MFYFFGERLVGYHSIRDRASTRVKQTWGAITGLGDVPLPPCLFTPQENQLAKDKLILLSLR